MATRDDPEISGKEIKMGGYSHPATVMSRHLEICIVRKFGKLNTQNLLYYQSELTILEKEHQKIVENDRTSEGEYRNYFDQDGEYLTTPLTHGDEKQWMKWLEIRSKLKQYNECLLQHVQISKLDSPDENSLRELRKFFSEHLSLTSPDRFAWHDDNERDLVVVHRVGDGDFFSRWVINTLIPFYHEWIGKYFKKPVDPATSRLCCYSDQKLHVVLHIFSTLISSLLPISSVIILYFVPTLLNRLGIIAGFTACFSVTLALMTDARKTDIFAATAAFAAVQVVFLSGNSVPTT